MVSICSGTTFVMMSTLPAMSSAVRVEASGMMRHTIRWKLPGSRTFSSTTSEPRVQDANR